MRVIIEAGKEQLLVGIDSQAITFDKRFDVTPTVVATVWDVTYNTNTWAESVTQEGCTLRISAPAPAGGVYINWRAVQAPAS